jgi:c-di-AMP phosphodiesterase-like protein
MLAGMIIDTQKWRVRTGSRTYDAASVLRKYGADPQKAYDWMRDTFDEFSLKSMAMACAERFDRGVIVAPIKEKNITRSLMSQVADTLMGIQGVEASFVIAQSGSDICVSARSGGRINVQRIMESMGGGGHMTAAAVQKPKTTVDAVKAELLAAADRYFKEETEDESDS